MLYDVKHWHWLFLPVNKKMTGHQGIELPKEVPEVSEDDLFL